MNSRGTVVVVGAGLAGARTVEALRGLGHDGPIALVGQEAERPYVRPPLSKEYLRGESARDRLYVHEESWYHDNEVELLTDEAVTELELDSRTVRTRRGGRLVFDALALTTGARSRTLDIPGADAVDLLLLRSRSESDHLRERLSTAARLVIVGSGWIGLEVAAAAKAAGVDTVVVERDPAPLGFVGPELAQVFAARHRDNGVDLRTGCDVQQILVDGRGNASGIRLADGVTVEADLVLVAVGAVPNDDIARQAGIDTDSGVLTDDGLRSSHPDVFAAGDVAKAFHPRTGRHERVEHWATAEHQPPVLAASMLGIPASYSRMPYFFSDQYDLSVQVSGFITPGEYDDVVVRGDTASSSFSMFWRRDGRVVAGLAAGDETPFDEIERLVRDDVAVPADRLGDVDLPLSDLGPLLVADDW